jgi:nucleotide-binding universal stress UspA family protein
MAGTIVVGVDGSSASIDALRWAADEARLRDSKLVVLHAWSFVPPAPIGDPGMIAIPAGDLAGQLDVENEAAKADLDSAISEALGTSPTIAVEPVLVEDDPADALVARSEEADLVVVGSHGKSGFRAALLGSVSRHVVDHAKCAVVVVKPKG